jgi:outer membrane biosynthesis protein TonB
MQKGIAPLLLLLIVAVVLAVAGSSVFVVKKKALLPREATPFSVSDQATTPITEKEEIKMTLPEEVLPLFSEEVAKAPIEKISPPESAPIPQPEPVIAPEPEPIVEPEPVVEKEEMTTSAKEGATSTPLSAGTSTPHIIEESPKPPPDIRSGNGSVANDSVFDFGTGAIRYKVNQLNASGVFYLSGETNPPLSVANSRAAEILTAPSYPVILARQKCANLLTRQIIRLKARKKKYVFMKKHPIVPAVFFFFGKEISTAA